MYDESKAKHKLVRCDDYIANPKPSGYRSMHRIYRYYSDRNETYNGLKIEVQIRSTLQHAWATAVETIGTFISQALKSSQGEEDWLRFFALMGSAIAVRERTAVVPDTPIGKELTRELRSYVHKLKVQDQLRAFGNALQSLPEKQRKTDRYFLLQLDPRARSISVRGYGSTDLNQASADYLQAEERAILTQHGTDAVLVAVESIESLRRAYPNYFLDTNLFLAAVDTAIR